MIIGVSLIHRFESNLMESVKHMDFIEVLNDVFDPLNTYIWYIAFVCLIGLGLFFLYKLKFMQVTHIAENAKLAITGVNDKTDGKKLSSFEAFCLGMGARIGVGNIAGVATAIFTGGPGAVFWMWTQIVIRPAVISCCSVSLLFIRPCEGTNKNTKCQMNLAFSLIAKRLSAISKRPFYYLLKGCNTAHIVKSTSMIDKTTPMFDKTQT